MATLTHLPGAGYGNAFVDALVWGGFKWSGPIKVWFGNATDFANASAARREETPYKDLNAETWTSDEKATFAYVMSVYSNAANISFQMASSAADADMVWWKGDLGQESAAYHDVPRVGQAWGAFNPYYINRTGVTEYKSWDYRQFGGDGLHTILNAIGLGLGLVHTENAQYDPDGSPFPSPISLFTWDQGAWTVMASGDSGLEGGFHDATYGAQGGLGAFDIAALQAMYGVNTSARLGNDVSHLPQTNFAQGTGWQAIWDAGGIDTISGDGSPLRVAIDLREATLQVGDQKAGGYYSNKIDVSGGLTISKGTIIENAIGGNSGDTLQGNAVGNTLWGRGGRDFLYGEDGNDVLYGEGDYDTIDGGAGDDLIFAGADDDIVKAGAGNDTAYGEGGDNDIYGADGNDALFGGDLEDKLFGDAGNDLLKAAGDRDLIEGGSGNDRMYGGGENDKMYGMEGDDIIFGEGDADFMYGGSGNDKIYGGRGADSLTGDAGNDYLAGGADRDGYWGGPGRDKFVLDAKPNKRVKPDHFDDFKAKEDQIVLFKKAFKLTKSSFKKGKLKKDAFTFGSKAKDKEDRIIADKNTDVVFFDPDGTGRKSQYALIEFKVLKSISYRDFEIA